MAQGYENNFSSLRAKLINVWLINSVNKKQAPVMKDCPSMLIFTTLQSLLSAIQTGAVAIAVERDIFQWKLGWDVRLIAVVYSVSKHKSPCSFFASNVLFCCWLKWRNAKPDFLGLWYKDKKQIKVYPNYEDPLMWTLLMIFSWVENQFSPPFFFFHDLSCSIRIFRHVYHWFIPNKTDQKS